MTEPNETPETETRKMRPIWYFVGWMLLVVGLMVVASGLINLVSPPEQKTVLYELHTSLWWGAVIAGGGVIFLLANRHATVD